MTANTRYLGLDITPWGLVFALIDQHGRQAGSLHRSFGEMAGPGEHEPADWWRAVRTGIKELLRRSDAKAAWIRGMALTGTEGGCVLLDGNGKVLFPALIGSSIKLHAYLDRIRSQLGLRNLANLTGCGNRLSSAALAPKLLAVREVAPRVWHDLHAVFLPRDYLRFRLSGDRLTDASAACGTLLFSPRAETWSKQVLERLEMDPAWFPAVAESQRISGRVSEQAARDTGLAAGTPLITGASQAACAALAIGAVAPGDAVLELGDGGRLLCIQDEARRDTGGVFHLGCHALPKTWTLELPGAASGLCLDWLQERILDLDAAHARRGRREPLDHLSELAAEIEPGADGLCMLPPHDEADRCHLLGLAPSHGKGHLVRATLEGSALEVALALRHASSQEFTLRRLCTWGPGARAALWNQILADATGHEVAAVAEPDLCARGAAVMAHAASVKGGELATSSTTLALPPQRFAPRGPANSVYSQRMQGLAALRQSLASPTGNDGMDTSWPGLSSSTPS